jgi:hypothetical protein
LRCVCHGDHIPLCVGACSCLLVLVPDLLRWTSHRSLIAVFRAMRASLNIA